MCSHGKPVKLWSKDWTPYRQEDYVADVKLYNGRNEIYELLGCAGERDSKHFWTNG